MVKSNNFSGNTLKSNTLDDLKKKISSLGSFISNCTKLRDCLSNTQMLEVRNEDQATMVNDTRKMVKSLLTFNDDKLFNSDFRAILALVPEYIKIIYAERKSQNPLEDFIRRNKKFDRCTILNEIKNLEDKAARLGNLQAETKNDVIKRSTRNKINNLSSDKIKLLRSKAKSLKYCSQQLRNLLGDDGVMKNSLQGEDLNHKIALAEQTVAILLTFNDDKLFNPDFIAMLNLVPEYIEILYEKQSESQNPLEEFMRRNEKFDLDFIVDSLGATINAASGKLDDAKDECYDETERLGNLQFETTNDVPEESERNKSSGISKLLAGFVGIMQRVGFKSKSNTPSSENITRDTQSTPQIHTQKCNNTLSSRIKNNRPRIHNCPRTPSPVYEDIPDLLDEQSNINKSGEFDDVFGAQSWVGSSHITQNAFNVTFNNFFSGGINLNCESYNAFDYFEEYSNNNLPSPGCLNAPSPDLSDDKNRSKIDGLATICEQNENVTDEKNNNVFSSQSNINNNQKDGSSNQASKVKKDNITSSALQKTCNSIIGESKDAIAPHNDIPTTSNTRKAPIADANQIRSILKSVPADKRIHIRSKNNKKVCIQTSI